VSSLLVMRAQAEVRADAEADDGEPSRRDREGIDATMLGRRRRRRRLRRRRLRRGCRLGGLLDLVPRALESFQVRVGLRALLVRQVHLLVAVEVLERVVDVAELLVDDAQVEDEVLPARVEGEGGLELADGLPVSSLLVELARVSEVLLRLRRSLGGHGLRRIGESDGRRAGRGERQQRRGCDDAARPASTPQERHSLPG
jgi:hypothetical protein